MGFEEFLPKEQEKDDELENTENIKQIEKINQDQFYDMLTDKKISWQAVIYDLIQAEQLDPWNIDLSLLSKKYLEKIRELEESNFFISSKVLLAASLLLRIKSEILLNTYIRSLDEILFGKKDDKTEKTFDPIEIDESEIPELVPRTPLPRFKQVTLQELMSSLNKAINTEQRRIRRALSVRQAERLSQINIPKTRVNVKDRIRKVYAKIKIYFKKKPESKLSFTELTRGNREEKLAAFLPILHLENQQKVYLDQEKHFEEIWIWLYGLFKQKQEVIDELEQEIEYVEEELDLDDAQKKRLEKINKDFENPLADFFDITSEVMEGEK